MNCRMSESKCSKENLNMYIKHTTGTEMKVIVLNLINRTWQSEDLTKALKYAIILVCILKKKSSHRVI